MTPLFGLLFHICVAPNRNTSLENLECFFCEADGHFQSGRRPHLHVTYFSKNKVNSSGHLLSYFKASLVSCFFYVLCSCVSGTVVEMVFKMHHTSKNACHRDKRVERMYTRISDSQIAWELDVITQMAWISLQNFGHLGLSY